MDTSKHIRDSVRVVHEDEDVLPTDPPSGPLALTALHVPHPHAGPHPVVDGCGVGGLPVHDPGVARVSFCRLLISI